MTAVHIERHPGEVRLVFEPALGISCARDLRSQLEPLLSGTEAIVLDASRVERTDAAAMQLIAAFMQNVQRGNIKSRWLATSPAFRNAAALLDLNGLLGVPA